MTENAKTLTFVVIGLAAIVVGLVTRPSSAELDEDTLVGADLTKGFHSPEDAKRLRIVRFDEDTATLRDFEVAEQDGLWSIPSKDGYPADAARQMAEAATSLMDRKILHVASKSAGDHEEYGVIDPSSPKLEPGQKGVGTRVTMFDAQKEPLVDLIVGKAVKDAEGQRYVREAGRDIVYAIEIDRSKLSTNFEDWIEKDLLKLNAWDLQSVEIKDYSAELVRVEMPDGRIGVQPAWDPRAEMTLAYNDADSKWSPVKLRQFDPKKGEHGEHVDFTLAEDEELNEESLNGLKNALDELQIVDVVRKPQGLSNDLKAGDDFMNNREALLDLMTKGFTAAAIGEGGPQEIISSDGEVIATMKNGVQYVLRFGNLTNVGGGEQQDDATKADAAAAAADKKKDSDVHRYLFVMARFDEASVKQPELQTLPELPAEEAAPAAGEANEAAPAETSADTAQPPAEGEAGTNEAKDTATTSEASAADKPAAEEASAAESTTAAEEAGKDVDAAAASEAAAAPDAEKNKDLEKIIAERKRIEQENQRKLDEYQETRKKGLENMKELNLRFGDWYFVIDDEVFQKIRLSRDDVVKKKEKPKAEGEEAPSDPNAAVPGSTPTGLPEIPGATE
jgi:hypothetical protein